MSEAKIGAPAPDFTTASYHDKKFSELTLSELRGKWVVLFFYPGDFTFVCTTELPAFGKAYTELREIGVEVLAASVDSKYVHKIWDEQELSKMIEGGIPYPMLADTGGRVGRLYGVFDEKEEVDVRGTFIIDPDGVLQSFEILPAPIGRNVDETLRRVKALQHARETGGAEVCPVNWEPGQQVLKPGEALVGQVWKAWKK